MIIIMKIMIPSSKCVFKLHPLILITTVVIICFFNGILIVHGEIGDTLINGEIKEISSGSSLDLREGYRLTIAIENGSASYLLSKDGLVVKHEKVKTGGDFYYFKKINFDNYRIISIPYFAAKGNKIQFRLYQYSEKETEAVETYIPRVLKKQDIPPGILKNDILKKAKGYRVLLDDNISIVDSVSMENDTYYVVSYSDPLPYAGGVEVFSANGTRISDESGIEKILTSVAWKEATERLNASEKTYLNDILNTSKIIDENASSAELDNVPPVNLIFSELNTWEKFSLSTVSEISDAFPSVEQIRKNSNAGSQFQNKVSQKISDFEVLRSRTIQMNARLNPISSISGAKDGEQQIAMLSKFKNAAARRKSELKGLWGERQKVEHFCKIFWC
ncbi:Uncharacterised protein [uncultured archaeon]|nr:Uncharacterised protein [uncultured archaeon]